MREERIILLYRHTNISDKETLGNLVVIDGGGNVLISCKSLELAWKKNKSGVSCIPVGIYQIVLEKSDKFKMMLWEMKGVPGRSETKIHVGNFFKEIQGCILLGDRYAHIDNDNIPDVANSSRTVADFHRAMYPCIEATIHIIDIT